MLNIPTRNRYRKRARFVGVDYRHDESTLDFATSPLCYNFDMSSGALRCGYGIKSHERVPPKAQRYWVYRYLSENSDEYVDQYVYQDLNGRIRFFDPEIGYEVILTDEGYPPMDALNYKLNSRDVLLLSCDGHSLLCWDGRTLTEYKQSPKISSMALHYERLFVTSREQPTKVFFSDDLDPTNWNVSGNEGGFIELLDERGELNKVVSFGSYLYIFRDKGISRVTAFGDQSEFSAVNLFVSAGRIYPNSIARCGAIIMFLASDGLYVFDGYECRRALKNLDGLLVPHTAAASAYFDGKYYLSCGMNFNDGKTIGSENEGGAVNGLLVYDLATGDYSITRGLNISYMNACTCNGEDMLMACDSGIGGVITKCGKRFTINLPRHWQSPMTDISAPDRLKSVRELYIDTATACTVTLSDGSRTKTIAVKAGNRRVRANISRKRFSIAVDTDSVDCSVRPITVIYS